MADEYQSYRSIPITVVIIVSYQGNKDKASLSPKSRQVLTPENEGQECRSILNEIQNETK